MVNSGRNRKRNIYLKDVSDKIYFYAYQGMQFQFTERPAFRLSAYLHSKRPQQILLYPEIDGNFERFVQEGFNFSQRT